MDPKSIETFQRWQDNHQDWYFFTNGYRPLIIWGSHPVDKAARSLYIWSDQSDAQRWMMSAMSEDFTDYFDAHVSSFELDKATRSDIIHLLSSQRCASLSFGPVFGKDSATMFKFENYRDWSDLSS